MSAARSLRLGPVLLLGVLLLTGGVRAHTSAKVDQTCPLCAHQFTCELDMSGSQSGLRLDLKPLGQIAAPGRVPVCPQCHFVLYAEDLPAASVWRRRST